MPYELPPAPSKADIPFAIMTDSPRKVKATDRAELIEPCGWTPVSKNLYYRSKRVRGVI
jgi:hypothetical protein